MTKSIGASHAAGTVNVAIIFAAAERDQSRLITRVVMARVAAASKALVVVQVGRRYTQPDCHPYLYTLVQLDNI